MKKFTFVLAAALCAAMTMFAKQVTNLNPYAYGVKAEVDEGMIAVQYQLNAVADSTAIVVYCDGEEVGAKVAESNAKGLHTEVVDLSEYTKGGKYTVGIRVFGTSYDELTQLKEVVDPENSPNDTTAVAYSFYHAKGVAIDNNPFSENFGRLITDEAMFDTPDQGYHSSVDKQGLYAFAPDFTPIANGNATAFKCGLTYNMYLANGINQSYAPYRIRINKDGRIFVAMQDDQLDLIYEASAKLDTMIAVVAGANAKIDEMPAINASLDLKDNEDGSISLLTLNCNQKGVGFNNYGWELIEYTIAADGAVTSKVIMDTTALISAIGYQKDVDPILGTADLAGKQWRTVLTRSNTQFQYAADGGYWFINSRSNAYEAQLAHIKADGTWDMIMAKVDQTQEGSGDFYGGAGLIERDGKIYVGMNRYSGSVGQLGVFSVDYTGANTVVTYEKSYRAEAIGRNLNDFAIDYANNMYTVGNSNEKIIVFAMPYSGMVETPVAAEVVITGIENVKGDAKVQKIFRNGQIIIVKDGVMYNALGAQL